MAESALSGFITGLGGGLSSGVSIGMKAEEQRIQQRKAIAEEEVKKKKQTFSEVGAMLNVLKIEDPARMKAAFNLIAGQLTELDPKSLSPVTSLITTLDKNQREILAGAMVKGTQQGMSPGEIITRFAKDPVGTFDQLKEFEQGKKLDTIEGKTPGNIQATIKQLRDSNLPGAEERADNLEERLREQAQEKRAVAGEGRDIERDRLSSITKAERLQEGIDRTKSPVVKAALERELSLIGVPKIPRPPKPFESAFAKERGKSFAENLTTLETKAAQASSDIGNISAIRAALSSNTFTPGAGAELRSSLAKFVEVIGLDPESIPLLGNPATSDVLSSSGKSLAIGVVEKFKGNLNKQEVNMITGSSVNFLMSKEGMLILSDIQERGAELDQQRHDLMLQMDEQHDFSTVQGRRKGRVALSKFNRENRIITDDIQARIVGNNKTTVQLKAPPVKGARFIMITNNPINFQGRTIPPGSAMFKAPNGEIGYKIPKGIQ